MNRLECTLENMDPANHMLYNNKSSWIQQVAKLLEHETSKFNILHVKNISSRIRQSANFTEHESSKLQPFRNMNPANSQYMIFCSMDPCNVVLTQLTIQQHTNNTTHLNTMTYSQEAHLLAARYSVPKIHVAL